VVPEVLPLLIVQLALIVLLLRSVLLVLRVRHLQTDRPGRETPEPQMHRPDHLVQVDRTDLAVRLVLVVPMFQVCLKIQEILQDRLVLKVLELQWDLLRLRLLLVLRILEDLEVPTDQVVLLVQVSPHRP